MFFPIFSVLGSSEQIGNGFTAHAIIKLDKTSNRCLFGVTPQKPGEYVISLAHTDGFISSTGLFNDNYCYSYSGLYYNVNGPDSNNYHIMEKYGVEKVGTYEAHKKSGVYGFVVR
jgi:hypothetical protein